MPPETTKKAIADLRPITLRSTSSPTLELRLKAGQQHLISSPGSGGEARFTMTPGKWAVFMRGQCILHPTKSGPGRPAYIPLYGSREKAVEELKANRHHGMDFVVVEPVADVAAPGAAASE